jgi:two-component system chemotaxis sensor kinase CheA
MSFTPDKELMAELMALFSSEAAEQLQSLNRQLLVLEQTNEDDERERLLAEILREAHTLKGGATAVDLTDVKTLAHHLESIFAEMQRGAIRPGPKTFDLLYQTLDGIETLVRESSSGEPTRVDVTGLAAKLASVAEGEKAPKETLQASPVSAPRPDPDSAATEGRPSPDPPTESDRVVADQPSGGAVEDTIRVATSKLDSLMARVGELVVARTGSQHNLAEVHGVAEDLSKLAAGWRRVRSHGGRFRGPSDGGTGSAGGGAALPPLDRSSQTDSTAAFLEEAEPLLTEMLARLHRLDGSVREDGRRMSQITADLQEDVRRARMLPASTLFDAFPRMVRDLAREQGKEVSLDIGGGDTEIDRAVLEQIKAPLTHLLRNCVDHGLEEPQVRTAAGKAAKGTITLSASQHGDTVLIEIADDGPGIDLDKVKATAIDEGLMAASESSPISDRDALSMIFRSGFSTSALITELSGRGVGLDVVRENIERLNGTIEVESMLGRGTRFSLVMPLTVTTTSCVLVRVGDQSFAVPISNVVRIVRVAPDDIHSVEGRTAISLAGEPVPLGDLAALLGLEEMRREGPRPALVVRSAERTSALLIDEIVGTEEVVIKTLPRPLLRVRNAAGATVRGTGEVVVVLNVADIVRSTLRVAEGALAGREMRGETADRDRSAVIMLADDSITTRTLEKNILQSAGYEVRVAADGEDAWTALQDGDSDLIVSDVQMPRMNGFELTAKIRSDERFKHLPVVLVTSLESSTDRERGIEVGADAYIGKSSFDQEQLLDVIRRLI